MTNIHSSSLLRQSSSALSGRENYNLNNDNDFLIYIYRSLANFSSYQSLNSALALFLDAGREKLHLRNGALLKRLSAVVYSVVAFDGEQTDLYTGKHLALENLIGVEKLVSKNKNVECFTPLTIDDSQCTFVGVQFAASCGQEYVLYFDKKTDTRDFQVTDNQLYIQLLAEGVAFMIEQNSAVAQKKQEDQGMRADGTVRSLEEYLEQSKIPETFGVPARVIEVLERRMGIGSLSISSVSEELNLSKRTLQRRLQQQDVNFADLRDKVRFHYSIDYLVKQHHSIDAISTLLDFSDRTSFTNAFKRWTGLSPSNFRKLFRDYV